MTDEVPPEVDKMFDDWYKRAYNLGYADGFKAAQDIVDKVFWQDKKTNEIIDHERGT